MSFFNQKGGEIKEVYSHELFHVTYRNANLFVVYVKC
jgi:hypothetical protein